jgi:tetratricopeptide (TPR) repeat protein
MQEGRVETSVSSVEIKPERVGRYVWLARLAAAVVVLAALTQPATAGTSTPERDARRRFDEAEVQYRAGHYAEALSKYQAGYAAMPLPGFLVNMAQCQRRLGDLKTARATYREFVLVAPDSRLAPEVETLIQQLDRLIADLASGGDGAAANEVGTGAEVHASDPTAPPPLALAAPAPTSADAALIAPPGLAPAPAHQAHARWWIWGGVAAAVVAGGVVTAIALSSPEATTVHAGTLGTLSR